MLFLSDASNADTLGKVQHSKFHTRTQFFWSRFTSYSRVYANTDKISSLSHFAMYSRIYSTRAISYPSASKPSYPLRA